MTMLELIIFKTPRGSSPVIRFIDRLPRRLRTRVAKDIELLEMYGLGLGMPFIKKLRGTANIWELRTRRGNDQVRILFGVLSGRRVVLLHGFVKSSNRLPPREIRTAEQRLRTYLGGVQ